MYRIIFLIMGRFTNGKVGLPKGGQRLIKKTKSSTGPPSGPKGCQRLIKKTKSLTGSEGKGPSL